MRAELVQRTRQRAPLDEWSFIEQPGELGIGAMRWSHGDRCILSNASQDSIFSLHSTGL
jgi:hypothetical protein